MATLQDRLIKCVDCGEEFTFTVGEQEFYVGEFYFNTKQYRAALARFEGLEAQGITFEHCDVTVAGADAHH